MDHQMSFVSSRPLSSLQRANKKMRNSVTSRPLPLSRVLETVDIDTLKNMLKTVCEKHPELVSEVSALAPRPTVSSALSTLRTYEATYQATFPYGGNSTGDYAHNRVRPAVVDLLEALSDYTPHFLPPNEIQASTSLLFLDGATEIIHRLPDWDNAINNHPKQIAYEEITKAWVLVTQEAAKRGAGISLQYGGWDMKLSKHDERSGGMMQPAVVQMKQTTGWMSENGGSGKRVNGFGFGMHSGIGVPVRTW